MKQIITLVLLLIISNITFSQVTFQKMYGGVNSESAYSVQTTADGGYIMTGYIARSGIDSADVYLVKTDALGNLLWAKNYGGSGFDRGCSVQQTEDAGYIITGTTNSFGAGMTDIYLIKTDINGSMLWSKTYGGFGVEQANSVQQTADEGYVIAGNTESYGAGSNDIYVIKTDSVGDTLWTKTYGGTLGDQAESIKQTADGGYIIAGYSATFNLSMFESVFVIKTDNTGNILWSKSLGSSIDGDGASSVQQTSDGGYIVAGTSLWGGIGTMGSVLLIKLDSAGLVSWGRNFGMGQDDNGYSAQQTQEGGYIIAGYSHDFNINNYPLAYLIKTSNSGNLLWSKKYGAHIGTGNSVLQASDGGYVIAGYVADYAPDSTIYDGMYLIKTDTGGVSGCNETTSATLMATLSVNVMDTIPTISSGGVITNPTTIQGTLGTDSTLCLIIGINELNKAEEIFLYPNPATTELRIENSELKIDEIEIYDVMGQRVFSKRPEASSPELIVDVSALTNGIYFLQLKGKAEIRTQKFIISR
jgi:hypothetical protein